MTAQDNTINILLVDENQNDFPIFLTAFAEIEANQLCDRPIELFYTPVFQTALKQLKKVEIHVILLSHPAPVDGGKDALSALQTIAPNARIVAVANKKGEKLAKSAMQNGAHGYWVKGKHTGADLGKFLDHLSA